VGDTLLICNGYSQIETKVKEIKKIDEYELYFYDKVVPDEYNMMPVYSTTNNINTIFGCSLGPAYAFKLTIEGIEKIV
jgi:hypothetical protein